MDNNTYIWSQISATDSKISACRSALAGILNSTITELQSERTALTSMLE